MVNHFYLTFKNQAYPYSKIRHIQYNIHKRINKIKYATYKRIDISLSSNEAAKDILEIEWNDKKTARIICFLPEMVLEEATQKENIILIYETVLDSIKVLWAQNSWNIIDIDNVFEEIKKEDFVVSIIYGKTYSAPFTKYKAEFFCEVFPDYANYYIQFLMKGSLIRKVMFLKGQSTIELFFGFFPNCNWKDSEYILLTDINKEIFFIFNANSDEFSLDYKPIINSLEKLHDYVSAFKFGISTDERMRLLGLPHNSA